MLPTIESERLYLREIQPEDEQALFTMDTDAEVHRFLGNKPIHTLEQAREAINSIRQQYVDNGIGRMAIVDKQTDQFVGWGGLKYIRDTINGHQNYYDLGYRLTRSQWGKGYATESSRAVIEYAFKELNLPALYAVAESAHTASLHVLEKCGFRRLNLFEEDGTPHYWLALQHPRGAASK